ncbi:MAG: NmrA family transcriptional regulator [Ponticaulis sp.]|nr:NmrA family transcriptional regulator [Ponticaulis sp.]
MNLTFKPKKADPALTLVLGATGKTGSRISHQLSQRGIPVRKGSRSAAPAFDWENEAGWDAVLDGVKSVYINYAPDLAVPGATDKVQAFVDKALGHGVQRAVLLSGRGETEAQASETIVQESGLQTTVIRASWFNQNFSEGMFLSMVQSGRLTLPENLVPEPYVDLDDIAEIAVAALTEEGHAGRLYEVTGPRALTFHEVAEELSKATNRTIDYVPVPHDAFIDSMRQSGAPKDVVWLLDYLFATVLDGRNSEIQHGIAEALGRPPTDFAQYARRVAASGLWRASA